MPDRCCGIQCSRVQGSERRRGQRSVVLVDYLPSCQLATSGVLHASLSTRDAHGESRP